MEMIEVSKLMEEYFRTVTSEQFERDSIDAGILECPDKFTFSIQGDSIIFKDQSLISNTLKVTDVLRYGVNDIHPLTINIGEITYAPYLQASQYLFPRKVA